MAMFGRGRGRGAPSNVNEDERPPQSFNDGGSSFRGGRGIGRGGPSNFGDRQNDNERPPQNFDSADRSSFRGRGGSTNFGDRQQNDNEVPPQSFRGGIRGGANFGGGDRSQNGGYSNRGREDFNGPSRGRGGYVNDRPSDNDRPSTRGGMRGGFDQPRDSERPAQNFDNGGSNFRGRGRGGSNNFGDRQQNDNGYERPPPRDNNDEPSQRGGFSGRGRGGIQNFGSDRQDSGFERPTQRGGFTSRGGYGQDERDFNGPSQRGGFSSRGRGGYGQNEVDNNGPSQRGGFSSRGRGGYGSDRQNGDDRPRGCFNCGDEGHMSRDCNEPRQGGPSGRGRSEFGGNRGGGFASAANYDNEQPIRRSFIPKMREVNDIFKDDEDRANVADTLYDQDAGVILENSPEHVVTLEDNWESAGFSKQILDNIKRSHYFKPRNFQKYAIPLIMEGHDIKGEAETGSGKSAAFLLPIIHNIKKSFEELEDPNASRRSKVSALIIEPTRELAKQLYEQASKFAYNTGVTVNYAYGEYNMGVNKQSLWTNGCDILVGTPGRLKHLLREGVVIVESLQFLVLDEADRLLDQNFMQDIQEMTYVDKFPPCEERQTLFFSATFNREIQKIANDLCRKQSVIIKNKTSGVNNRIRQEIIFVPVADRKIFLLNLLKKEAADNGGKLPKKLVFVETKRDADFVATMLSDEGIKAQTVNGDRSQELREAATAGFKNGEYLVLVVTNVFARGMDFTDLGQVINMFLPSDRDTYVHRIGRTGRLNSGVATSFFDPEHQQDRDMTQVIITELEKSGQEVPDFVRKGANPFSSYSPSNNYNAPSNNGSYANDNNDDPLQIEAPDF